MGGYDYTVAERQQRFRVRKAAKAVRQKKALRRMVIACDRIIRGENIQQAARWAKAWALKAGEKNI